MKMTEKIKKNWYFLRKRISAVMACIVVFVTVYAMVLPAITLDHIDAEKAEGINLDSESPEKESGWEFTEDPEALDDADEDVGNGWNSENWPLTLTVEGEDYTVTAVIEEESGLPWDVFLQVEEIEKDSEEYAAYCDKALEAVSQESDDQKELSYARFFDISFLTDEGVVEPTGPVSIVIDYQNEKELTAETMEELSVVHFDQEDAEDPALIEAETQENEGQVESVAFTAESFSVYGVVGTYTVDFHWEVDGKTYDFSIPGGGFVSFEHLVELLGINKDAAYSENDSESTGNEAENDMDFSEEGSGIDGTAVYSAADLNALEISEQTRKFVANVENVEFSSPELVWVGKVDDDNTVGGLKEANGLEVQYSADLTEEQIEEINAQTVEAGDWALISMIPFTSEESLTVTMKNGDQFVVRVTDASRLAVNYDSLNSAIDANNGSAKFLLYATKDSKNYYLKNDGTTTTTPPNASTLNNYTWTVSISNRNSHQYYFKGRNGLYLNLNSNGLTSTTSGAVILTQDGTEFKMTTSSRSMGWDGTNNKFYKRDDINPAKFSLYYVDPSNSSGGSTSTPGIELTDDERQDLETWKNTLAQFNTLTDYDKTAEVVGDGDNRMYKVDLTASSGIMDFYRDVDLGFVLDVSNSMKFPSSLKAISNTQIMMTQNDLDNYYWNHQSDYNREGCFYIISDPAVTSTIYKVFYDSNGIWNYVDASEPSNTTKVYQITDSTVIGKDGYRKPYTLYYADDTKDRFSYLKESVDYTVQTLHKIVKPTEGTDDETANVRIAYNFFCSTITKSESFKDLRDAANNNYTIPLSYNYTASGTKQNEALYDANGTISGLSANEFGWKSGSDQYVILVTDGAPNGPSMQDVRDAAQNLKTQYPNVKIITVGLSTKDVEGGSQMLYDIADDVDGDGQRDFYEAEKANDLEYILLKILQSIMAKGFVKGTITDTVDKAFYPVDANGKPLSAGVYNTNGFINGAEISDYVSGGNPTAAHKYDEFYTVEQVGDNWKITWYNQKIGWDDGLAETGNPWNGTFYVKAKEDYLGGNLIETNTDAKIKPTGLKLIIDHQEEENWRDLEGMPEIGYPVPRVNVHNLETDGHTTTWTVYKGTSISPEDQLKALWDQIPIEEVVSATENNAHKVTTGQAANVGSAGQGETFPLGSLMAEVAPDFDINSLIGQITASNASVSESFDYNAYGHESGRITVTVERTKGNKTPEEHTADTVGQEVEQYKITFTYKPYTEAERRQKLIDADELDDAGINENDYHNGPNGRGREENGTITSTNTHTINVYEKALEVYKTDAAGNPLANAVFSLYKADEANGMTVAGLPGKVTQAASGTSGQDGIVRLPATGGLEAGTVYYLKEESAPQGYVTADRIWIVQLQTENGKYTDLDGTTISYKAYPFNWDQGAKILVDGIEADSFRYQVVNNADEKIGISVRKTWEDEDDPPESITFELYRVSEKGHTWDEGRIVPATCSEEGVKEYTCTECGKKDRVVISKTDHTPGEPQRENEVAATCQREGGYDTVVRCAKCNAVISTEHTVIPITDHIWGEPEEEEQDDDNICYDTVIKCTVCGLEKAGSRVHHEHDWGEWNITTQPTTTEEGEEARVCRKYSSHIQTRILDKLPEDTAILYRTYTAWGNYGWLRDTRTTEEKFRIGSTVTLSWSSSNEYSAVVYVNSSPVLRNYQNNNGYDFNGGTTQNVTRTSETSGSGWWATTTYHYSVTVPVTENMTLDIKTSSNSSYPTDITFTPNYTANAPALMQVPAKLAAGRGLLGAGEGGGDGSGAGSSMTSAQLSQYLGSLKNKDDATCEEKEGADHTYKELAGTYTITPGANDTWTLQVNDLPKYNEYGNEYTYYVVETSPAEGYEVTYTGQGDGLHNGDTAVINNKKEEQKGALTITKAVTVNQGSVPASHMTIADGTYTFMVTGPENYSREVTITVSYGTALESVVLNDLKAGQYTITETGSTNPNGITLDGPKTVDVAPGSEASVNVAAFTNNLETVNARIRKHWIEPEGQTSHRPESLEVTLSNGAEVVLNEANGWSAEIHNLPKYDAQGNEIQYSWTEENIGNGYSLLSTYTEDAVGADGVITHVTELTNGPDEHYNPKTTFSGIKIWRDNGEDRPASITVVLYKDVDGTKTEVMRQVIQGTGDSWSYHFTNVPIFDDEGNIIQYYVEEILPEGYSDSYLSTQDTTTLQIPDYQRDEANDQVYVNEPNNEMTISTGVNLGFIVMKHGNDFIIWTPRKASEAELLKIKQLVAAEGNAVGDQEFSQILSKGHTNAYGVPSGAITKGNMTASIYMDGGNVMVDFGSKNWSQLAWGQLGYTYTPGKTDLINTQKYTDLEFGKKWIDSVGREAEWEHEIQVTVERNKADGTKDEAFSLVYTITKDNMVDGALIGTVENPDSNPRLKVSIRTEGDRKKYRFSIENLPYSGSEDGVYTYFVTETGTLPEGYLDVRYENTSAPTGTSAAYDQGTIINQEEGIELPSTGGPGNEAFSLIGSVIICLAAAGLMMRRR